MKTRFLLSLLLCGLIAKAQTIEVSGLQSGVWDADTVKVTGNVIVEDALSINPGTTVLFDGYYSIRASEGASITAIGTKADSITFSVSDTSGFHHFNMGRGGWNGIRLENAGASRFEFCRLQYGKAALDDDQDGGALRIFGCNEVEIGHSTLFCNFSREHGGALNAEHSTVVMHDCKVNNNLTYTKLDSVYFMYGGGLRFINCEVELTDMTFRYNNGQSAIGGALSLDSCEVRIDRCRFEHNHGVNGGGLYLIRCHERPCSITNSLFANNVSEHFGGGLAISDSSPLLSNLTVVGNLSIGVNCGGIFFYQYSAPTVMNCIVYGNHNNIPLDEPVQMWSWTYEGMGPKFHNCIVQYGLDNISGNENITVYENCIEDDPLFANPDAENYHINANSPCVNAGSPDTPDDILNGYDLDGKQRLSDNRIDIGAYEYSVTELTNLVIFLRFADDPEITHPFASIDTLFNGKTSGYLSIYNFFKALTYDKIHYNTVYTNNIQNGQIISFQDSHPRGYYEPYSPSNPIGYQGENPFIGISRREAELLAAAFDYVEENHLVDDDVVLDGDGDGDIDNVSFVVKGGTGEWASILWPHMEYFPHDSIDHPVQINGIRPNTFNFEFEGAPQYFNAHVFRHEMGHSMDLPDLYHYINYDNVSPAGSWDMMCYNYNSNHTAAIYKNKILHVCDDPIEITEDGDYTLLSVGSSPMQNCYYIKSAIDSTQWYVFEYRNQADLFDEGIPGTGLIAARWNDTVPLDYSGMFANAFFDFYNVAHQYWIFRPGSSRDTQNGNINNAHFSFASGRTSFGPTTNPHPFLTDGTPENSFEITDIHEYGDHLTFHVHFFDDGTDEQPYEALSVHPNPASDRLQIDGEGLQQVEIFNAIGQQMLVKTLDNEDHTELMVGDLPSGIYMLRIATNNGSSITKKIIKE